MIEELIVHRCDKCGDVNIHRNGRDNDGRQKYYCKGCGHHGRLSELQPPALSKEVAAEEIKSSVVRASMERCSLRGLERIFGVSRAGIMTWLKERLSKLKRLKEMISPAQAGDIVELDELWSFVGNKGKKRWIWIAICRRTRKIIAFAIGDRSEKTARTLWRNIPESYQKEAFFYSDFWDAYAKVCPKNRYQAVGKDSGETNHVERWNNTLRQRVGRFVRKSLSFSKLDQHHYINLRLFIHQYNSALPV